MGKGKAHVRQVHVHIALAPPIRVPVLVVVLDLHGVGSELRPIKSVSWCMRPWCEWGSLVAAEPLVEPEPALSSDCSAER